MSPLFSLPLHQTTISPLPQARLPWTGRTIMVDFSRSIETPDETQQARETIFILTRPAKHHHVGCIDPPCRWPARR